MDCHYVCHFFLLVMIAPLSLPLDSRLCSLCTVAFCLPLYPPLPITSCPSSRRKRFVSYLVSEMSISCLFSLSLPRSVVSACVFLYVVTRHCCFSCPSHTEYPPPSTPLIYEYCVFPSVLVLWLYDFILLIAISLPLPNCASLILTTTPRDSNWLCGICVVYSYLFTSIVSARYTYTRYPLYKLS